MVAALALGVRLAVRRSHQQDGVRARAPAGRKTSARRIVPSRTVHSTSCSTRTCGQARPGPSAHSAPMRQSPPSTRRTTPFTYDGAREEHERLGDVRRLPETAERVRLGELRELLGRVGLGRHRGLDRARRDDVHADPARSELGGERPGQADLRGLGRGVDRAAGMGLEARDGRGQDHRAAGAHVGEPRLKDVHDAADVDVDQEVDRVVGRLLDRPVGADEDAGVGAQHVDRPEPLAPSGRPSPRPRPGRGRRRRPSRSCSAGIWAASASSRAPLMSAAATAWPSAANARAAWPRRCRPPAPVIRTI